MIWQRNIRVPDPQQSAQKAMAASIFSGYINIYQSLIQCKNMADQDIAQKDVYFVAVKVFLEKEGRLLILKDKFDCWDLPGGRIKKHEFETPLKEVVARKMSEEVGGELQYELDEQPIVLMRHERIEASPGNPTVRIFGIGYRAKWMSKEIKLSDAHNEMKWVDLKTFRPEEYFTGGWLRGVRDYLAQTHTKQ